MNKKVDLIEATKQAILEEDINKITPMEQRIINAVGDAGYDIPDEFILKIVDEFRTKSRQAYFARYKVTMPKYLTNIAPDLRDYSLDSLLKNPQIIKYYYDNANNKKEQ